MTCLGDDPRMNLTANFVPLPDIDLGCCKILVVYLWAPRGMLFLVSLCLFIVVFIAESP